MYSNYNELFELISEYESPTPLNDTCALILLLILGFVKNYSTVEELKADFEDLHICNEIMSLELLIIFDQSIDYLLKSSIVKLTQDGMVIEEDLCRIFLIEEGKLFN
ncbi:hypothetical protein [Lysinibacillus sphaericus]|uniref:Uncharacterized protein n=1 Tax=Lysinibacillus sphaericus TaxID=1421 RepID=A0A6H0A1X9_LYSSH|nr:hypothetical protein [Lysinibacillus sphaericus]QIS31246.1 hypothetical protein [Lysinibacillus sphaericus]QPA61396.1 hypothetical protein INQ55_23865 [Lysinibacillus sphaericus]